jgi:hypothetical protein
VRRYFSWILAFKFEDGAVLLKVKEMEGDDPPRRSQRRNKPCFTEVFCVKGRNRGRNIFAGGRNKPTESERGAMQERLALYKQSKPYDEKQ